MAKQQNKSKKEMEKDFSYKEYPLRMLGLHPY